jgi:competence protein ComEC
VAVLDGVPVGRVLHNGQRGETDLWDEVFGAADSLGIPTARVSAGDTLALDPTVRLRILGPSDALARAGDSNEASVVVMLEYGRTRALLTGDAEHAGEAELVARYGPLLRADVVKVGHHGSRTSSTAPLVAAVASGPATQARRTSTGEHASGPAYAVVSVALRNRYGLPNDEPLERWARTGAEVLQTAHEGAVWLRSDGRAYTRFDWRR